MRYKAETALQEQMKYNRKLRNELHKTRKERDDLKRLVGELREANRRFKDG